MAHGRSRCDFKDVIFNFVLLIGLTAPSHYLSQCWLSSSVPNGVARPQWVNQRSQGCYAIHVIHTKFILISNRSKYRSSLTSVSIGQSFWNFVQNTTLSPSIKWWANEVSRDFGSKMTFGRLSCIAQHTRTSTAIWSAKFWGVPNTISLHCE